MIAEAAQASVPPALVKAVARAESGFDPNAVSRAGAQGLMQLMPTTAAGLGVTDPFDPKQNLMGGAKFLRGLLDRFGGDVSKVLAGYNAGPGAGEVRRHPAVRRDAGLRAEGARLRRGVRRPPGDRRTRRAAHGRQRRHQQHRHPRRLRPRPAERARPPGARRHDRARADGDHHDDAAGALDARRAGARRRPSVPGHAVPLGRRVAATGFDCSGLMQYAFKQLGVDIPRVSQDQYTAASRCRARPCSPATSSSSPRPATSTTWACTSATASSCTRPARATS